ncbi:hypothetical protein C0Q70_14984 [Pomacea canaliculata]|uniref:Uncharacterized protein n=1 Tax=Pomacea canaliculata TaxID=400727 RepID=A0A2T7NTK7_POMCA|nr:hypothetical protein C0Q70_14984 [Pomacea canaliculata]
MGDQRGCEKGVGERTPDDGLFCGSRNNLAELLTHDFVPSPSLLALGRFRKIPPLVNWGGRGSSCPTASPPKHPINRQLSLFHLTPDCRRVPLDPPAAVSEGSNLGPVRVLSAGSATVGGR